MYTQLLELPAQLRLTTSQYTSKYSRIDLESRLALCEVLVHDVADEAIEKPKGIFNDTVYEQHASDEG